MRRMFFKKKNEDKKNPVEEVGKLESSPENGYIRDRRLSWVSVVIMYGRSNEKCCRRTNERKEWFCIWKGIGILER